MLYSRAKSKYIRVSPLKLRLVANTIRGYNVVKALALLQTLAMKRVQPVKKTLISAYSNAKNLHSNKVSMENMFIKEIKVDQGPIVRYFKPGAMGRANPQARRLSHLEVVLVTKDKNVKDKN